MNESAPSAIQSHKYVYALDCPDARALGTFYAKLFGWHSVVTPEYADWVSVVPPKGKETGFEIACQEIGSYCAPEWPDGPIPQQAHLDFYVESLDESAAIAEAAGATRHSHQPGEAGTFIVFVDPVGHPFCLCQA